MYLEVSLILIAGLIAGIFIIVSRKFSYLRKLPVNSDQPAVGNFFSDFFPEIFQTLIRIDFAPYRVYLLREFEKILRRLKVVSLKLEAFSNSLLKKIRTNDAYLNSNAKPVKPLIEPIKVLPKEEPNYLKEEQNLIIEIAKDPKNPELYRKLADIYMSMKNFLDAKESLQTALKLDPEDEKTKEKLAKAQEMLLVLQSSDSGESEVWPLS